MKIYDAHVHTDPGTPEPNRLLENMEECGVYGAGLYSLEPFYDPDGFRRLKNLTEWTHDCPDRLIPVFWIHPREEKADELIRAAVDAGVRAFKMIAIGYSVDQPDVLRFVEKIAKTDTPIIFHSGILYDFESQATGDDNRPLHWEHLLELNTPVRFSLAHCSWPWTDECIALMGKLNYVRNLSPDLRARYTELFDRQPPQPDMYVDTTPGPATPWREDLFRKLFYTDPHAQKVMFGSDRTTTRYRAPSMKKLIAGDLELCQRFSDEEGIENYFGQTFLNFLKK